MLSPQARAQIRAKRRKRKAAEQKVRGPPLPPSHPPNNTRKRARLSATKRSRESVIEFRQCEKLGETSPSKAFSAAFRSRASDLKVAPKILSFLAESRHLSLDR